MTMTPLDNWIRAKTGIPETYAPNSHVQGCRSESELKQIARAIEEYQLEKLRETLGYAKTRSRFYRGHLSGTEPENIKTIEDVRRIPFTAADMITKTPLDFVCVRPGDIGRIVTIPTSGTTGPPKRVYFTNDDQELTRDFFHHGMTTLADENDLVIIFLPGKTTGSIGDLLLRALERFNCRGIVYGPIDDYQLAGQALSASGAVCAVGLPSQLFALSRFHPELNLKSVLLCSDYVSAAITHALESTWGCEVFSHYGMIESGLGGGVDCSAHAGYHMREADLLFEIVDPVSGDSVPDGKSGEIVFTTLTRRGMPLIRYKTGDISRVLPDPCPCGSFLRRFGPVSGRTTAGALMRNGYNITMPALDELLFTVPSLIGFSAEFTRGTGADTLTITVFAAGGTQAARDAGRRIIDDAHLGEHINDGLLKLEIRQGGVGALTYGNTKRGITGNTGPAVKNA